MAWHRKSISKKPNWQRWPKHSGCKAGKTKEEAAVELDVGRPSVQLAEGRRRDKA